MIQPPIHPRVRLAENCGKFFVLCFQPVTFPCALCAQVTQAFARETMATAHSRSARDRHWTSWALGHPDTVQTHSPHLGDRRARPRPGKLSRACTSVRAWLPESKKETISESKRSLLCEHVAYTGTIIYETAQRTAREPCIPLRNVSYDSSSMESLCGTVIE